MFNIEILVKKSKNTGIFKFFVCFISPLGLSFNQSEVCVFKNIISMKFPCYGFKISCIRVHFFLVFPKRLSGVKTKHIANCT